MALVAVGGAVVLTTVMVPTVAMADEITFQSSNTVNAGGAFANSGGNTATGNSSSNSASSTQTADGGLASNTGTTSNTSNGTANVTTGAATATGSVADNNTDQNVAGHPGDDGLTVGVQSSNVVNAGVAGSNTGGNDATGNDSSNSASSTQEADGLIATNHAGTTNNSTGTATITTGAATATGTSSANDVDQTIAAGVNDGLSVLVQDADVINLGAGFANSGGNSATGNDSSNSASNSQDADGFFLGSNTGTTGNTSTGTGTITTGVATAIGNLAANSVDQSIKGPNGDLLAVVFQHALAANIGVAGANSGLNTADGNTSSNALANGQTVSGLIATNLSSLLNSSDGAGLITTGIATGKGNEAANDITQNS